MENIWSILDKKKLQKLNIDNAEAQMKNALQMAWLEISNDTIRTFFEFMSKRLLQVIKRQRCASRY